MSDISTNFNAKESFENLSKAFTDLANSVSELKAGLGFTWYEDLKITSEILNNNNTLTLPNNRFFTDYDSKALLIFINGIYTDPSRYKIVNKNTFYFLYSEDIKVNDVIHIIHLDKRTESSNSNPSYKLIAKSWEYNYTNNTDNDTQIIKLPNTYTFTDNDKHSVLVYIDGLYINPLNYELTDDSTLTLLNNEFLNTESSITIIQLGRVTPNNEYIGYLWGETINIESNTDSITLTSNHSFFNQHDTSALVFINNRITRDYTIENYKTLKFNNIIQAGSHVEIIQLGFTTDLNSIKNTLNIDTIKNLLDLDMTNYIDETKRNKPLGFVGLDEYGLMDSGLVEINSLSRRVKNKFVEQGWLPYAGEKTNHIHNNMDVLWKLQLYNNKLYVNGYPVGEQVIEVMMNVKLTEDMLNNCRIHLPNDCDPDRPITFVINSIPQLHDNDWILIENDYPVLDEISWKNKQLQNILQLNDIATITYYKKIKKIQEPLPPSDMGYGHYHDNMQLLEALSINELNQLCINGIPIQSDYTEVDRDILMTSEIINNKYFEIPDDYDSSKPISLTLNSQILVYGVDYNIEVNEEPYKDKIIWEGLGLENILQPDDNICMIYYKKN